MAGEISFSLLQKKFYTPHVSELLSRYFKSKGFEVIGKFNAFQHPDDENERSFEIDLAIGPLATGGCRSSEQEIADFRLFDSNASSIDSFVDNLSKISLFPCNRKKSRDWRSQPNPNPLVGIAIEIENNLSKYFLGSLLAAAITGRWGIVIIDDPANESRWISTLHRMIHKGAVSPIPTNILIMSWRNMQSTIKLEMLNNKL